MATSKEQFSGQRAVPKAACVFACPATAVQFAAGDDSGRFRIQAYDGGVTNHWYWGNFAIDLEGLTFAADPLPILDTHETNRRVGVTTNQQIDGKVTAEGRFLKNATAQELRADMTDGFPMQASLAGRPAVVEQVEDGATVAVNGHTLKGPGAVWRQASIYEISMCAFGALNNTRSTAFADTAETFEIKETIMAQKEQTTVTVESFQAEHRDLYDAIFAAGRAEGQQAERQRFAAVQKACGSDTELAAQCFADGMNVADALAASNEKLRAQLAAAQKPADKPQTATEVATAEFKAQPAATDKTETFDEAAASDDELKAHFAATSDLRDRFSSAQAYIAHVRHPARV